MRKTFLFIVGLVSSMAIMAQNTEEGASTIPLKVSYADGCSIQM